MRTRLPDDRTGVTQKFKIISKRPARVSEPPQLAEIDGYIQSGEYDTGQLGEIFVKIGKPGSSDAIVDAWATACSIALQRGATVDELFGKFAYTKFEPAGGVVGVDGITLCSSPLDLISRWVLNKYGTAGRSTKVKP